MKYKDTIGAIIIIILLTTCIYTCNRKPIVVKESPVYDKLRKDEIKVDSAKALVVYRDTGRIQVITKWRTFKAEIHDTLYHEIISICDTVIYRDSLAISARDKVIRLQDSVKADLYAVIDQKNDTIRILKKEIKNQKWQKRGILALWVIREGLGVVSKVKQ